MKDPLVKRALRKAAKPMGSAFVQSRKFSPFQNQVLLGDLGRIDFRPNGLFLQVGMSSAIPLGPEISVRMIPDSKMNILAAEKQVELSVVMPCLNKQETVGVRVRKAHVCQISFL